MNVTLRLFAAYRERVGSAAMQMALPEGSTVGDLARNVARRYPALISDPAALVVAVNLEYQAHDFPLSDGDEAALIPPVSGGQS